MGRKARLGTPYFRDSPLRGPGHPRVSKKNLSSYEKSGVSEGQRLNTQGLGRRVWKIQIPISVTRPYLRIILSKNSEGSGGSLAQESALQVGKTQTPNSQKEAGFREATGRGPRSPPGPATACGDLPKPQSSGLRFSAGTRKRWL